MANLAEAEWFLQEIFGRSIGPIWLGGPWNWHGRPANNIAEALEIVNRYIDTSVYVSVNTLDVGATSREKEYCNGQSYVIHADLDELDPRKLLVEPTIIIQTSSVGSVDTRTGRTLTTGRHHAWWILMNPVSVIEAEQLSRNIAYYHNIDKGFDRTRYLRVPGTHNHNYENKPEVTVVKRNGPSTYRISDFAAYPTVAEISQPELDVRDLDPEPFNIGEYPDLERWLEDDEQYRDHSSEYSRYLKTMEFVFECAKAGLNRKQILYIIRDHAPTVGKMADEHQHSPTRYLNRTFERAFSAEEHGSHEGRPCDDKCPKNPHLSGTTSEPSINSASSWLPVNLRDYLEGRVERVLPAVGFPRSDGIHLLYPSREHAVYGEMECGKSWFCLASALHEIEQDRNVLYLHFEEDDPYNTTERLQLMGGNQEKILEHFHFASPTSKINQLALTTLLNIEPILLIIDGLNEALSMSGYSPRDEKDIASFRRTVIRPFTTTGVAVLIADHVAKSTDGSQLGSIHKGNALSGTQILMVNQDPFGRGREGRSNMYIMKDRGGFLRQHGVPDKDMSRKTFMGQFVVNAEESALWYGFQAASQQPKEEETPSIGGSNG